MRQSKVRTSSTNQALADLAGIMWKNTGHLSRFTLLLCQPAAAALTDSVVVRTTGSWKRVRLSPEAHSELLCHF